MARVSEHILVPRHEILSEEEKKQLLERLMVTEAGLPKIFVDDPAIKHLKPKIGSVVKITRNSPTAGQAVYYRVVVERTAIEEEEEALGEEEEVEEEGGETE
ncbi:MAG: DNA-directed RNA polymerase subunit H [Candidatus Aenigmatarchaeota archaeon]